MNSKIQITSICNKITDEIIANFEQEENLFLPSDYKEFLIKNNGGYINPNKFKYSTKQGCSPSPESLNSVADINVFYCVGVQNQLSIKSIMSLIGNILPEAFLAIGNTSSGDKLCIALKSENYGQIYLWAHGELVDDDDNELGECYNVYFISDNFEKLLENLF